MNQRNDKSSLVLRAQEILTAHPEGMTIRDALKQAMLERYQADANALAEVAATALASGLSGLRKRTYDLPEPDDGAMFQIPQVIGIRTPEGDLLVARDSATLGQARQWQREGQQHHSTQLLRFKRAGTELQPLKEEADDLPWWSARHMLTQGGDEPSDE